MSSIYRKGRDGYFYYQSYVFNPASGKKDKRVFHALGTKDYKEANKKKIKLDRDYKTEIDIKTSGSKFKFFKLKLPHLIVGFLFIIFIFRNGIIGWGNKKESTIPKKNQLETNISTKNDFNSEIKIELKEKKMEKIKIIDKQIGKPAEKIIRIPQIPQYELGRIETISGAFNQGKIFLTVDKETHEEDLLLLCKHISNKYSEFSNILICLYANTEIGKELANGNQPGISVNEKKELWLGLYTYNAVEGEYFDSNPADYLGVF